MTRFWYPPTFKLYLQNFTNQRRIADLNFQNTSIIFIAISDRRIQNAVNESILEINTGQIKLLKGYFSNLGFSEQPNSLYSFKIFVSI